MLRFIVRRLLQLVLVAFVLSVLLFTWLKSLPGGTVSAMLGERATPQAREALTRALGLDQPIHVQYWTSSGPSRVTSGSPTASSPAPPPCRSSPSASPRPSS